MNSSQLKIDIVSDIVCPWCAIGYKKLSKAITQLGNEISFEVNWKPYELHPEIPEEGFDKKEYYKIKFGESSGFDSKSNFITGSCFAIHNVAIESVFHGFFGSIHAAAS